MDERLARNELSVRMKERAMLKREYDTLKAEADRLEYEYYCTYESDEKLLTEWLETLEKADKVRNDIRANVTRQNELRCFVRMVG